MASGHGVEKPDTANHPGRQVSREVFDKAIGPSGEKRTYVSRYDDEGNFVSQGYT